MCLRRIRREFFPRSRKAAHSSRASEPKTKEQNIADRQPRIQTWALEEARRRLEKEGILEDPSPAGGIVEKIVGK
jgi:hypothetical protein